MYNFQSIKLYVCKWINKAKKKKKKFRTKKKIKELKMTKKRINNVLIQ